MGIGIRLKEILHQKKMTVAELSRASNVSPQSIYAIIKRDNKTIQPEIAAAICKAIEIPVTQLMSLEDFATSIAAVEIKNQQLNYDNEERHELLIYYYDLLQRTGRDALMDILSDLRVLNNKGLREAVKRVSELAELPQYTTPDSPNLEDEYSSQNKD